MILDDTHIEQWCTSDPADAGFEARWRECLARAPHASFELDPDALRWAARDGVPRLATRVEHGGRSVAMAARHAAGALTCGSPWRWAVVADRDGDDAVGLTPADAALARAALARSRPGARVRLHLPADVAEGGFRAGTTCLNALTPDADLAFARLDDAKRRAVRKALRAGYQVVEARSPAQFRAFAALQRDTEARRGRPQPPPAGDPAPGEAWREWELPWMWLLVAERGGEVAAGSGFGRRAGGSVDYRTNASSERAKKDGANVLLAWEAMRRAGEAGHRWLNWCGATRFKRELGGVVVPVQCELGGGARWALSNALAVAVQRARPWGARLRRAWRPAGPR